MSGPLPQRWCTDDAAGRHNAAIAGILETAPIVPRADGLVLFAELGSDAVLRFLVAVKSLHRHLSRGRVAVIDDGTLTAQDRTILAQHCGDPDIFRPGDIAMGDFPRGIGWEALLALLDRRGGEYWLQLAPDTLTLSAPFDIERAISSNRSFAMAASTSLPDRPMPLSEYAQGLSGDDAQSQIERVLARFGAQRGWRYMRVSTGMRGFAAGQPGRDLARAYHARLGALDPVGAATPASVHVAAGFLLANEGSLMALPPSRYAPMNDDAPGPEVAVMHFAAPSRYEGSSYAHASRAVIAALAR